MTGDDRRMIALRSLQRLLDDAFRVPGTTIRFGWDPLIGLVPWAGDVLTAVLSGAIILQAHHLGVPRVVQLRMIANVAIDVLVGAIPVIGDVAILDFEHEIDGAGGPALCMPGCGSARPSSHETVDERLHYVKQDGQAVFKFAVRNMEEVCRRILVRNHLTAEQIDLFVPHQASSRIILSAAEKLGLPREKVVINIDRFGNTTAGTIPLALSEAVDEGRLKRGDLVLLASVGAGFTVGGVLVRWA